MGRPSHHRPGGPGNNTEQKMKHTPGPWAWFGNPSHNQIYLATEHGGRIYVMDFVRMGFHGAQPRFQKDGVMKKAEDLATFAVCNAEGYKNAKCDGACYRYDMDGINHPDARLIAAAPDLLAALETVLEYAIDHCDDGPGCDGGWKSTAFCNAIKAANATIAKAKGDAA